MIAEVEKEDCGICRNGEYLNFTITTVGSSTKIVEVEESAEFNNVHIVQCYSCERKKYYRVTY